MCAPAGAGRCRSTGAARASTIRRRGAARSPAWWPGLSRAPYDAALALGVDLPLVRAGRCARCARGSRPGHAAVRAGARRRARSRWRRGTRPRALAPLAAALARGERSLVRARARAARRGCSATTHWRRCRAARTTFLNVNTPADLAAAERALAARGAARDERRPDRATARSRSAACRSTARSRRCARSSPRRARSGCTTSTRSRRAPRRLRAAFAPLLAHLARTRSRRTGCPRSLRARARRRARRGRGLARRAGARRARAASRRAAHAERQRPHARGGRVGGDATAWRW